MPPACRGPRLASESSADAWDVDRESPRSLGLTVTSPAGAAAQPPSAVVSPGSRGRWPGILGPARAGDQRITTATLRIVKGARLLALAVLPGAVVFALAALGVRDTDDWYHPVGLVACFSTMVSVGVSVLVWAVDKVVASRQTARLRRLLAGACGVSAALLWTAASLAYSNGTGDAGFVFLVFLPVPVVGAAALGRHSRSVPQV